MVDPLEFGAGGWLRAGARWEPSRPFYAVIGDPVSHSLSPRMHNAALIERGLATEYLAVTVASCDLRRLKSAGVGLAGFNVTAPHKEAVAALCDGQTDQARSLGAVNTVRVEDGRWLGHNTDSGGMLALLTEAWPGASLPDRACVLGTGGSARAAVDALLRLGLPAVEVFHRSSDGRDRFAAWLTARDAAGQVSLTPLVPDTAVSSGAPEVWVCCLAGGVAAGRYLPAASGPAPSLLLDIRYGDQLPSDDVPFGFAFSDGLPMLLMQGGLSFAWWFGPPVPWAAMRDALPNL